MSEKILRSRAISQILSYAGYKSAGVRQRRCGYIVPANANGYGCAEMVTGWPGSTHRWRSVLISWYGDEPAPFAEIASLLADRGLHVTDVNPRHEMTGRPSITVWLPGADEEPARE